MAYVGYEDLKPALINRRIIPSLRRYYREDGTFDLFNVKTYQLNCIHYLSTVGEAGLVCHYGTGGCNYGSYSMSYLSSNASSPFRIYLASHSSNRYNAHNRAGLKLSLTNRAGLYPYYLYCNGWGDKGGWWGIQYYSRKSSSWVNCSTSSNRWQLGNGVVFDWLDMESVQIYSGADDTSKYTNANADIDAYFIHRYSQGHPLYRYYT